MAARILPLPRRLSAEEKVRQIERDIVWRMRRRRAKRFVAERWPHIVLVGAVLAEVVR